MHYRLFDELLEVREPRQEIIAEKRASQRDDQDKCTEETRMERTYKKIEIVGSSDPSFGEAPKMP